MDIGLTIFPTDETIRPDELARAAEDLGFESVWFPEHTHIPASRVTPYPAGGELPREYSRTFDPFVALTAAAGATSTLRLGTGVCLVVERDPIVTAKAAASLDWLSGGRLELGVGAGWNREEMANHGTEPATRFALLRERVEAIKAIWTSDEASYHGELVGFDRIWSWPKPVQSPHPRVHVGGAGPTVVDRVLDYGDGWMPIGHSPDLQGRIAELRERADAAGRGHLPVTVFGARSKPEALAALADAGADRAILWLPPDEPDAVRDRLKRYADLLDAA